VREEDGVLIVPVLEERLVVRTELVLTEELRIHRNSRIEQVAIPMRVRSERAEVARSEGPGPKPTEPDQG
jgi:stress response protein YsnF